MTRERGQRIPADERERYVETAWSMSVRGKSYREIGKELDVHPQSVSKLVKEHARWVQHQRTYEAPMSVARYQYVFKLAIEAFHELARQPTSTNRPAYLNRAIEAQKATDDVTGAKAPVEWKGRIEQIDLSKFTGKELADLERLFERAALD